MMKQTKSPYTQQLYGANRSKSDGKSTKLWFNPSIPLLAATLLFAAHSATANEVPVITSVPSSTVNEDNAYEYIIEASDADNDPLIISVETRPNWLTFNSSTSTLSGTPTNDDVGNHNVKISVTDGSISVDQAFTINVTNTNDIPVITNNISNVTLTEDEEYTIQVDTSFSDIDQGDTLTFSAENLPTGLSISGTGTISGSPNNEDAKNSPFEVTVTATDQSAASVSTKFQISVTNVNDAPEPVDDSVTLSEDGATTIDVLRNDVDVDNDLLPSTTFITNTPVHGEATVDTTTGLVTYVPDENYNGTDTFQYRITDPAGLVGTASVNLTILGVNDPPVSQNDIASTNEDTTVSIDVLANDSDPDEGDAPQGDQIIIETTPSNGQVIVNNGMVDYTPNANFSGTDTFSYKVADRDGEFTEVATVTVTVGPVNDFPTANDDIASTTEDREVEFAVVNNDTDTEDGTVSASTITIVNHPQNGTALLNSSGTISYTPNPNFNGEDSLEYTVKDKDGYSSNAAKVTITVRPVNDNPQANSDLVSVDEDTSIDINVLGNDIDIDDQDSIDKASVNIITEPNHGSVFIDSTTGIVKYTPEADYFGNDSFSYTMADTGSLVSNIASVSITINSVNDAPRLVDDSASTDEDNQVTIVIVTNDIDVDGSLSNASLTFTQDPAHGTATFNSSGQVVYSPNQDYNGNDQFAYTISDNEGLQAESSATVLITVNPINDQPIALDGSSQTYEDKSVDITLTGTDVDEDTLSYTIINQPTNGTLSGSGANISYIGNENFNGTDSFTFTTTDGLLTSAEATISLEIISVNDRPVGTSQTLTFNEDESVSFTLTGTDIDSEDLTYRLAGGDLSGTVTGSAPNITYTPAANFNGEEALQFIVNDGDLDSASESIYFKVQSVNDTPTVENQDLFLNEDSSIAFVLDGEDIDNDDLTYIIDVEPTNGTLSGVAPSLIYTPNENTNGSDSMSYHVNDGTVDSEQGVITFSIAAGSDAPIAYNQTVTGDEDTNIFITLSGEDPDGIRVSYQIVTPPAHGTIDGEPPEITYIPDENHNGSDIIEFKVSDGSADSNTASVTININPVNDAPEAVDDTFSESMIGKDWLTLNVLQNDIDIDGDSLSVKSVQADFGSAVVTNNQVRYVPEQGFAGDVLLRYTIEDPTGESDNALIRLSVINNNDVLDPQITTSGDINMVATGRLTRVEFEAATAVDKDGNMLGVELLNQQRNFPPGAHNLFWRATDAEGRTAIASQKVNIYPQVLLSRGQNIEEGQTAMVTFKLNGPAPVYPIVIPYDISGNATFGIDYEMPTDEIRIQSGVEASIAVKTLSDSQAEDDEYLMITLGNSNYVSAQNQHRIDIVESNRAPRVSIQVSQDNERRRKISRAGGTAMLKTQINDVNSQDSHFIEWQAPSQITQTNASGLTTFEFDPSTVSTGHHQIAVFVTDSSSEAATSQAFINLEVVNQLATLGSNDSDGDLIIDTDEGHEDSDGDGIANYLDPLDSCELVPHQTEQSQAYLAEVQSGGCLRLGRFAENGLLISTNQLPQDLDTQIIGGLFDFEIYDIEHNDASFNIVLPQRQPIPADAIYRKYHPEKGWYTFIQDQDNQVWSAQGSQGICPPPLADDWQTGLNEGDWCVRLTIKDGGGNDDDGLQNYIISDPSGVAIYNSSNQAPIAEDDMAQIIWNSSNTIDVLANDSDADNDSLSVISAQADIGEVEINNDSSLYYSPLENFVGADTVNYSVSDGHGGVATAQLTITVIGNNAPVAVDDNGQTTNDTSLTINVLLNDSDQDEDSLTITAANIDASQGTVTIENNRLIYLPQASFVGTAIISYSISDNKGGNANAKAYVVVSNPVTTDPTPPPVDNGGNSDSGGGGGNSLWLLGLIMLMTRKIRCR